NGNKVVIDAANNNKANRYVQSMTVDGQVHTKNYLSHDQLLKGTTVKYQMASSPNQSRGVNDNDLPYSFSKELKSVNNKNKKK
ncbi:glycoside hydrolase domain-containing protein, partial [Dysgonomonas gadei]|uniref:glycoside hydrolase domain-containing protein n=1 Tax=Dysgonomonas gadei TaxID=156974 RepID=UPI003AEF5236